MRRFRRPVSMGVMKLFCLAGAISCSSSPATAGKPAATATTRPAAASTVSTSALQVENASVLAAWRDYLANYNDGRGVVLIGHSEGADALAELIVTQVNLDASVRQRLVSAILTGANLPVSPQGNGPFSQIGACRTVTQTGCVVAYNAFSGPVPRDALFGWP